MEKPLDLEEWTALGLELAEVGPEKFSALLEALRKIVDAQRMLARFDWHLMFRSRPTKRYQA